MLRVVAWAVADIAVAAAFGALDAWRERRREAKSPPKADKPRRRTRSRRSCR